MSRRRLPRRELMLPAECGSTHGIGTPKRVARAQRPTRGSPPPDGFLPRRGKGNTFRTPARCLEPSCDIPARSPRGQPSHHPAPAS